MCSCISSILIIKGLGAFTGPCNDSPRTARRSQVLGFSMSNSQSKALQKQPYGDCLEPLQTMFTMSAVSVCLTESVWHPVATFTASTDSIKWCPPWHYPLVFEHWFWSLELSIFVFNESRRQTWGMNLTENPRKPQTHPAATCQSPGKRVAEHISLHRLFSSTMGL